MGVAPDRRHRVPDPLDGADAREKTEERGRETGAELQALTLLHPLPARELVADPEAPLRRLVDDGDTGLELPRSREKRRQVDAGVPVDGRAERLIVDHVADPPEGGRVEDVDSLARVAGGIVH